MRRIQGSAMFLIWSIRFHLGTNFFCPTYNFPEDICNLSFFSLVNVSLLASNLKIDYYRMISAKGCGALQHTGIDRAPRPHFWPGMSFSCPRPPVRSPIPGPGFSAGDVIFVSPAPGTSTYPRPRRKNRPRSIPGSTLSDTPFPIFGFMDLWNIKIKFFLIFFYFHESFKIIKYNSCHMVQMHFLAHLYVRKFLKNFADCYKISKILKIFESYFF